jgi:hypothetical protein
MQYTRNTGDFALFRVLGSFFELYFSVAGTSKGKPTLRPPNHAPKQPASHALKQPTVPNRRALAILAIGFAFSIGVLYEWEPLNGIRSLTNWDWAWQDLDTFRQGVGLLAPGLAIAGILWTLGDTISEMRGRALAAILAIVNFAMLMLSMVADPRGLDRVGQIVASPDATAYFTDAANIHGLAAWLGHFQQASLHAHASTHPAGPIVFYYAFLQIFGADAGAQIGGYAVGLAGSAGVFLMYFFAGLWTADRRARVCACAFYALLPALLVFFPEFDQAYPIFSMLMILTWIKSLDGSNMQSAYLGAILFLATFFAYNLLATGAFLAYYGIYFIWRRGGTAWTTLLRSSAIAISVCVGLYLVLWLATGYNAPAAFRHAMANQAGIAANLNRRYGIFAVLDLYDLCLGAGIIAVPLLYFYLRGALKKFDWDRDGLALTLIGLATILTVDLSGLLRGETARVWLFLQPLLVVPVAIELSRYDRPWRISIFAMQWFIAVCIKAKMSFVEP